MTIADDFVLRANGDIRHVGRHWGRWYTVTEFGAWLRDQVPIAGRPIFEGPQTPNLIVLAAPYNLDLGAAKKLKYGTIYQMCDRSLWIGNAGAHAHRPPECVLADLAALTGEESGSW